MSYLTDRERDEADERTADKNPWFERWEYVMEKLAQIPPPAFLQWYKPQVVVSGVDNPGKTLASVPRETKEVL